MVPRVCFLQRPYSGNPQYTYNSWSPPAQSNETSNGYFLERSHSARVTLAKACELCPEDVSTALISGLSPSVLLCAWTKTRFRFFAQEPEETEGGEETESASGNEKGPDPAEHADSDKSPEVRGRTSDGAVS